MTQGKLAAELGDQREAGEVFAGLAENVAAPERVRAEALVRLAVVQRAAGEARASGATFRRAMQSPGRDAQVTRLLTLAVAGVAPDRRRWATQWSRVRLASASSVGDSPASIEWPGSGPRGVRDAFPAADPVTFDLEDVPLLAFLHHLLVPWHPGPNTWPGPRTSPGFEAWPQTYQPPAEVQRLSFAIHAGVGGFSDLAAGPRITVKASSMPWNELLENVLASNGLGFVIQENLLFIARVEDLGAVARVRGRTYGGPPISLNFLTGDIRDVFRLFADVTGLRILPEANLQGSVTLLVSERPALWVLDLVLAANDLTATRIDTPEGSPEGTAVRIQRLAEMSGEAVDLSGLEARPLRPRTDAPPGFASSASQPFASVSSVEGRVQVKKAGTHRWISADQDMPLGCGDLVRTGPSGSGEIRFATGMTLPLGADSLIVIDTEPPGGALNVTSAPSSSSARPQCKP